MSLPPSYVIWNREIPRRKVTEDHFRNFGINATWVEGIHGKTFNIKSSKINGYKPNGDPWYISKGHKGLCLSHYMVWTLIWHAGHEEAIVFEDDAYFGPTFHQQYRQAMKNIPSDWQVCYLGWLHQGHDRDLKKLNGCIYDVSGCPFGTHAMLLKRSAIRVLLDTQRDTNDHIDISIHKHSLPQLKTYFVYPSIVAQRSQNGKKNKPKAFKPTV